MRVPCISRWLWRVAAGGTTSELATAMDLFPTLAAVCDASLPDDRPIDGRDISALLFEAAGTSPHEAFFYYGMNDLEAVRDHRWKLHPAKVRTEVRELYDLAAAPGESEAVVGQNPAVVARLLPDAETARR